jgi:putative copper export protein
MDDTLVLCRLLHYCSGLLLFGISAFQGWLAPQHLACSLDAALARIVSVAAFIGLLSAVAWLLLASGEMGDGWGDVWNPSTWYAVLTDTEFGRVWQIHLLLAAALVSFLMSGWGRYWRFVAVLSAVSENALRSLRRSTLLELALGVCVVAVVSLFGTLRRSSSSEKPAQVNRGGLRVSPKAQLPAAIFTSSPFGRTAHCPDLDQVQLTLAALSETASTRHADTEARNARTSRPRRLLARGHGLADQAGRQVD